jgi:glycosyltransferase involved in cell wall biosynthesis
VQHFVLDLSRLISNAAKPAPTGIDRVEIAYATRFLTLPKSQVTFAAMTGWGRFGPLDYQMAAKFIAALTAQWYDGGTSRHAVKLAAKLCRYVWLHGEWALHLRLRRQKCQIVYLNVSHHHLDRPASIMRLKQRAGTVFVALVHDLIPIEYPEYSRPNQDDIHRRRIATVASMADAVIVPSKITKTLLSPKLIAADRSPEVLVCPLGLNLPAPVFPNELGVPAPYFICIGTIEPRKNHLLLLKLWRKIVMDRGFDAPHLVIVGRRGWENENIIDMLERCPTIRGRVHEFSSLTDSQVCGLIQNARALLMPSFSEGFGLPVMEALALGTPALCSEIPALLEVGSAVPEFFDPMDGPSWHRAILDYAQPNSIRRAAQIDRLEKWSRPSWEDHFTRIDSLLTGLLPVARPVASPGAHNFERAPLRTELRTQR